MSNYITITKYAEQKGCSRTAIYKAIDSGKISQKSIQKKENGKFLIDPISADQEWKLNHNPVYDRTTQTGGRVVADEDEDNTGKATMSAAKRAKAVYDAKLAELDYKKKLGTLVEKDKVYSSLFALGKEMRTALLAIPDRVTDDMLASSSRNDAFNILYEAIAQTLEQLSDIQNRPIVSDR